MEELAREKRRHSTQRIPHETLTRDRGRRRLAIAIGGERVTGLEDEEDTDSDEDEGNEGGDPVEEGVLREAVDEEADGEPDCAEEGAVETGFGRGDAVLLDDRVVLSDLEKVESEADCCAQAEGDVGEAGDAFAPAFLFLEGDGDHGEEEEG